MQLTFDYSVMSLSLSHRRRSGVGLAVVNGQLFAVGGFDGTTYLKTIEASPAFKYNF